DNIADFSPDFNHNVDFDPLLTSVADPSTFTNGGLPPKVEPGIFSKWATPEFLPDLIPIIPRDAILTDGSGIKPNNLGKIPGHRADSNRWYGFPGWTKHEATMGDILTWDIWHGADNGVGVGLIGRTWVGVDSDVTDPLLATMVKSRADTMLGPA